jgi:hypothetical protein
VEPIVGTDWTQDERAYAASAPQEVEWLLYGKRKRKTHSVQMRKSQKEARHTQTKRMKNGTMGRALLLLPLPSPLPQPVVSVEEETKRQDIADALSHKDSLVPSLVHNREHPVQFEIARSDTISQADNDGGR